MTHATPQPTPAPHQRGAVDLSQLSQQASPTTGTTGGSWVVEVTEATFDQVAQQSLQYPVVLELYSPRDPQGRAVSDALVQATNAAQGRWLLARVDVDASPRVAQALQATAVPYVIALLGGQAAPLFQGTRSADEIARVLEPQQPQPDPRFEAADAALAKGDYAAAVAEFDKVLAQTPNDSEAMAGRAQSALLARSLDMEPEKIVADAKANPDDVEAQLAAADLEVIGGVPAQAFDRLVGLIRELRGEDREPVRVRLLELVLTQPTGSPEVAKARRALSSALFT